MIFLSALVLSGAIVYLINPDAGALLIAAGCAAAVVKWLSGLATWQSKPTETQEAAQAGTDRPA